MEFQTEESSSFSSLESPVEVYTEWDPLEEVIVGIMDDIRVPEWDTGLRAIIPRESSDFFQTYSGRRFPEELVSKARQEVNTLARILEAEGIRVKRPNESNHHQPLVTPHFTTGGTFYSAMPRDCLFAIGKKIIEVPMAWRSRYFETFAFRDILNDYFSRGADWISAPKPMLKDDIWEKDHDFDQEIPFKSIITEVEPLFDAADFMKMGRDIIGQRSHVTNNKGIEWLRRTLEPDYRIHIYEFEEPGPMHIDTTILPLAPGRVLVNKGWVPRIPDLFKDWEILNPPPSNLPDDHPLYITSKWIHINVLMLDERTVVVEQDEEALISAFRKWGFKTILCPFKHFQTFGGSFHCATLDVKRRGSLKSYI
ncbi:MULTISPECIES: amidinotransferase [unclassified Pseudomonas]|uniref:amidinotransferase n=1 Tax=unclassified Pseudomonas TaxID=196821 RepID=UPI00131DDB7E|nr:MULTISPECIES: amidinotransferase [unclassified Pseudomonas]